MNDYCILKSVNAVLPDNPVPVSTDILIDQNSGLIERIHQDIQVKGARILEDYRGLLAMPGFIDPHVHFRIPGKPEAEDWQTGSHAALSGGVTTVFDMPNNQPALTNAKSLQLKLDHIEKFSLINYGLFGGLTQDNLDFLLAEKKIKAIKVYLASTTGDLLIRNVQAINFANCEKIFSFHAEDETTIEENSRIYGNLTEPLIHSKIRSEEAALKSTMDVVELQKKTGGKFHITHVSTAREMDILLKSEMTFENAPHHIFCSTENYRQGGFLWKCNPPLRKPDTAARLQNFLYDEKIQMIATDHAPHLLIDKDPSIKTPASGIPSLEVGTHFILSEMSAKRISPLYASKILSSNAATRFDIEKRGFLKEGFFADIAIINENHPWIFRKENIYSKCGWSPFLNFSFRAKVEATIVNGFIYNTNELKNNVNEENVRKIFRV